MNAIFAKNPRRPGVPVAVQYLAASLLVTLMLFAAGAHATLPVGARGQPVATIAPMLERATPAVVNVATEGRVRVRQNPLLNDPFFRRFFNVPDQPHFRRTQSLGSGVIVDAKRGLVLTNHHVIANADAIAVTLHDGRRLLAKLVGTDPETDIAVIRIPAEHLTALPLADSDKLRVGDFVVAIGNPFGLGQTVTSGIISALGRSGNGIEGYEDFIQTDASINPGNSGGALVTLNGKLAGINTAIYSQSGGSIGIGFAIPANMARQVMGQLVKYGKVSRGYIGAQTQDLTPELARAFGIQQQHGAVIVNIMPGSPGDKAGFRPGDVVIAVNGKRVDNSADVRNIVGLIRVGESVVFDVIRGGKRIQLSAEVAGQGSADGSQSLHNSRLGGASFADIDRGSPLYGRIEGVLIVNVERGGQSWNNGLRKGDIVTSVNRKRVRSLAEFLRRVNDGKGPLLLRIQRGNTAAFLVIK